MRTRYKFIHLFSSTCILMIACIFFSALNIRAMHAAKSSNDCVEQAFMQLGINDNLYLNPELLKKVLTEDMYLGGFHKFIDHINPYLTKSSPVKPMLDEIKAGITNRHPAIYDFLCLAIETKSFAGADKIKTTIERVLHHTFLLNELTKSMRDLNFKKELKTYFSQKKHEYGISKYCCQEYCDVRKLTGSIFQPAKLMTVEKVTMRQYFSWRESGEISKIDVLRKNAGLRLNIAEARMEDLKNGAFDNAMAASALSSMLVKRMGVDNKRGIVVQELPPDWDSLYHTWNWAFIMRNLADLEYILPKLLIPEVMNAEPDAYLYKRGIALWVTIIMIELRRAEHKKPIPIAPQMEHLADMWGKINVAYAKDFIAKNKGDNDKEFFDFKYSHSLYWDLRYGLRSLIAGN